MLDQNDFIGLAVGYGAPTLAFFAWVVRKLFQHDTALAVLVEQGISSKKIQDEIRHDIKDAKEYFESKNRRDKERERRRIRRERDEQE